jgi:hypothetical protein
MSRPAKKNPPDLILTLDFGGSGLKAIYREFGRGQNRALYMKAEVIPASLESLLEKTNSNISGSSEPENLAWVGVGDEYRAVGYLAATRYNANPGLAQKKYTNAIYRTLAAVWVVQQKLKLPNKFRLALATVLPPGEFSDTSIFLANLKEALNAFMTPTGLLRVKLVDFCCYQEGIGVYLSYCRQVKEAIAQTVVGVVMIGYRNASVLISRLGAIAHGKTADLGMVRLVDLVLEKTSGLKAEQIVKAITDGGTSPAVKDFLPLTEPGATAEVRKAEAQRIIEVVRLAKSEYAIALVSWLGEVLPREIDEIIFCGGTVDYLKDELDKHFPATSIKWHGGFEFPASLNEKWLGNRLADAYELANYFSQKLNNKYAGKLIHA